MSSLASPLSEGFVYVWEYRVKPEAVDSFERAYGPEGRWVQLFRRHPGFLETKLLRDLAEPLRYVTIDCWRSRADSQSFRDAFPGDFEALDRECAELTSSERHLGDFAPPGETNPLSEAGG